MKELVAKMLEELGEDPHRDGLRGTPRRVEQSMKFLTKGNSQDADTLLNNAMFDVKYDEMVIVTDIDFLACASIISCRFSGSVTLRTSRTRK